MSTVDATHVLVGTPDQLTTGAILSAPLGTKAPTDPSTLDAAFTGAGYVSSDGVKLTPDYSTSDIPDWSGAAVRTVLEKFTGELDWVYIQTDYDTLVQLFGAGHVTKVAANQTHGEQIKVSMGAHLAPEKSFAFKIKDGNARVLIYVPSGQIIPAGDMTFNATDPISWPAKLSCHKDAAGESVYVFTDDGVVAAG